jgi:hypothetical protein
LIKKKITEGGGQPRLVACLNYSGEKQIVGDSRPVPGSYPTKAIDVCVFVTADILVKISPSVCRVRNSLKKVYPTASVVCKCQCIKHVKPKPASSIIQG